MFMIVERAGDGVTRRHSNKTIDAMIKGDRSRSEGESEDKCPLGI